MSYRQLTREQRYQIYALQKARHSQSEMASIIGVHKSTISRELARNGGQRGSRPKQADELATSRKLVAHRPRIQPETWASVESLVRQQWSPEQISGRLKLEQNVGVSHERIYQHIYADKRAGGQLHLSLRCQKKRRKRYGGGRDRRGTLPARRSIDERPAVVDSRRRLGDWEADTIIGRNHRQAIVSLVDRKSKLTRLARLTRNTAQLVGQALTTQLASLTVLTITSDNGREARSSSTGRAPPESRLLLRTSLLILGARHEREHQRASAPILPQEKRLLKDHGQTDRKSRDPAE